MLCFTCFEDGNSNPCEGCESKRELDPGNFGPWVYYSIKEALRSVGCTELDENAIERLHIRNAFGMKTCRQKRLVRRIFDGKAEKFCNRCQEWQFQEDFYACNTSDGCSVYCIECTKQTVKESRR